MSRAKCKASQELGNRSAHADETAQCSDRTTPTVRCKDRRQRTPIPQRRSLQNKPTAAPLSGRESRSERTLPPRPWGDKPIKQVSYREIAAYVAKLLHIEWPECTEAARDGPGQTESVDVTSSPC